MRLSTRYVVSIHASPSLHMRPSRSRPVYLPLSQHPHALPHDSFDATAAHQQSRSFHSILSNRSTPRLLAYSKPHPLARSIGSPLLTPHPLDPLPHFDRRPSTLHTPDVHATHACLMPLPISYSSRSTPCTLDAMLSFSLTTRPITPSIFYITYTQHIEPSTPLTPVPPSSPRAPSCCRAHAPAIGCTRCPAIQLPLPRLPIPPLSSRAHTPNFVIRLCVHNPTLSPLGPLNHQHPCCR